MSPPTAPPCRVPLTAPAVSVATFASLTIWQDLKMSAAKCGDGDVRSRGRVPNKNITLLCRLSRQRLCQGRGNLSRQKPAATVDKERRDEGK